MDRLIWCVVCCSHIHESNIPSFGKACTHCRASVADGLKPLHLTPEQLRAAVEQ